MPNNSETPANTRASAEPGELGTGTFLLPGEAPSDLKPGVLRARIIQHYTRIHFRKTREFAAGQAALRKIKADLLSND
jgi:hypothetical protein